MRGAAIIWRLTALASVLVGLSQTAAAAGETVSFNAHIRPIFAKHCVACHGGVKQAGGVSFIYREEALAEGDSGLTPIAPGDVAGSYLLDRVADPDPETRMPPAAHGPPLSEGEIALLRAWIEQGAPWDLHWSFIAPRPQAPPPVAAELWPRDPLDRFILARIEAAGLAPAAEADRPGWLRRVFLDLTGLPPTAEDYAAFELDNRPDAYERVVDALLASPRYGERWASLWLDLARYADTVGFEKDPHREAWPYRDWLIRALNDDLPFDQFTVRQLAGDLLPDATLADRLATGFHRNTQTNTEGGTDDEEYRTLAVLDRVATTWQTWQGSTFRCTQCHSHPYDPFRHEEYYKFVALFNTTRDADLNDDRPLLRVPHDSAAWDDAQQIDARISAIRHELFDRHAPLLADDALWRPLACSSATATGTTEFVLRPDPADAVPEVLAEGTTPAGSTFTLEFPLGEAAPLAAVRIDALPLDPAAALKTAEAGFVLSHLTGQLVAADGAVLEELPLAAAACDEPEPLLDPERSLDADADGWGDYTRMSHPRRAVFLLRRPVAAPAGSRLRLALAFGHHDSGGGSLYLRRTRVAVTAAPQASALTADEAVVKLKTELAALLKQQAEVPGTLIPVMAEQPTRFARRTYTFARGNWLDKETEVAPGVPAVLPPLPAGVRPDRLAMARWLVSPENPLTARVAVNRLWQELFGTGLVETADDFGTSGERPSHPELLDHLALQFQNECQWSLKRMLRVLVLSATYRQAGVAAPEKIARDPRNRLLARGPRTRLTAEMVRDQALLLSGRLSTKMYGPPVMPPQPDGVWRSVYSDQKWTTAEGEDRYRRAVYTYCKRTSGYPSFITFDAPSRDVCVARRLTTNTPLQALVTLNDPAFIELAAHFAERMQSAGKPAEAIAHGYHLAIGRKIHAADLAALVRLYDEAAAAFDADPAAARGLSADRDRYALTVVANALWNLDELLTR